MEINNSELKHYGVLGMKWGMRRAEKKGKNYNYTSMKTKRLESNLSKMKKDTSGTKFKKKLASRMIKKQERRLNLSKALDSSLQKYVKKTSTKKLIAQDLILGIGAPRYRKSRSVGNSRKTALQDAFRVRPYMPDSDVNFGQNQH
ncbi:MAG: hypothetical protein SPI49_03410 [Eubacteriales bacterium]|nr:hypothetical protein [Eubacteriales bacterium]